jgi:hypothetical protein
MTNQTPNELRSLRLFLLFAIGLGAILPLCGRLPLGLAFLGLGGAGTLLLWRIQQCEKTDSGELVSSSVRQSAAKIGFTLALIVFVFFQLAIPRFNARPRRGANESAAIATLKNICSAQAQYQAAGVIDRDADGVGEYGYFADLATGNPPLLSAAFAKVGSQAGVAGGVIVRSGYIFQMFLPDASHRGVAEARSGGTGSNPPNADSAELTWCCYAWPASFGNSGRRAFFINQEGDVLGTKNLLHRYSGGTKVPSPDAAFLAPSQLQLASSIAAHSSGMDGQVWLLHN